MKKIIFEKVGARLRQARELRHITLEEAGKKVDVHKSTVLRWENGETEKIKLPVIETLASYYNVDTTWLMGYDVPMERNDLLKKIGAIKVVPTDNTVSIPIVGVVKAGYDYLAQENWIGTIDVLSTLVGDGSEYFALKVTGDSMSPIFIEGDIVLVHKQNDCENNQVAVVIINGDEGTLKKVKKTDEGIILQPFNPNYMPAIYTNKEIKELPITIAGVFKQLIRNEIKF